MFRTVLMNLGGGAALVALLTTGAAAEPGAVPGVASLKEAMALSAQRNVPIVVDFSTDW